MRHRGRGISWAMLAGIVLACAEPVVSPISVGAVRTSTKPNPSVTTFTAGGIEYLGNENGEYGATSNPQATITGSTTLPSISCNGQTRICSASAGALHSGIWEEAQQTITLIADYGLDGDEIFNQENAPSTGAGACTQSQQVSTGLGWFYVCVARQFSSNHNGGSFQVEKCTVRAKGNTLHRAWFQKLASITLDPYSVPILQFTYGAVGETSQTSVGSPQTTSVCSEGGSYTVYQPGGGPYEGCAQEDVVEVWLVYWWPYSETKIGWYCDHVS